MALKDVTAGIAACPKCGKVGPLNFRFEDRLSLRAAPKTEGAFTIASTKRVLVCVACGEEAKILGN